jgi:hypothetical protein
MRVFLCAVLATACAHDVRAHVTSADPPSSTGAVTLVLTRPAETYAALDGVLVVDGANTKHIQIDGVPSGYHDLAVAMGDGEKTMQVWVESGKDTVIPLPSPQASPTDSIRNMILSLAAIALYAFIK